MSIDQEITPITPLPSVTSEDRPAAVDQLVEVELPRLSEELPLWQEQLNSTATNINAQVDSITLIENNIEVIQEDVEGINTNVNEKYEEIKGYVIPEEATYDPGTIDNKLRRVRVLNITKSI